MQRTDSLTRLSLEGCVVDLISGQVRHHDGRIQRLSERERALLAHLAARPHHVFDRARLLHDVWAYADTVNSRAVDMSLVRLRRKIEVHPNQPRHIRTEHGRGVSFFPLSRKPESGRIIPVCDGVVDLGTGEVMRQLTSCALSQAALGALRDLVAADAPISANALAVRHDRTARGLLKELRSALELDPLRPRHVLGVRGRGIVFQPLDSGPDPLRVANVASGASLSPQAFEPGLHRPRCTPAQLAERLHQLLASGQTDEAWLFVAHGRSAEDTVLHGAVQWCGFGGRRMASLRKAWSGRRVVVGLVCADSECEALDQLTADNTYLSVLCVPPTARPIGPLAESADAVSVFASAFTTHQAREVSGVQADELAMLADAQCVIRRGERWEAVCVSAPASPIVRNRHQHWVDQCASNAWLHYEQHADHASGHTLVRLGEDLRRALQTSGEQGRACPSIGRSLSQSLALRWLDDERIRVLTASFSDPLPDIIAAELAHASWREREYAAAERYARRVTDSPDAMARGVARLVLGHALGADAHRAPDVEPLARSVAEDPSMPAHLRGWAWIECGNACIGAGRPADGEQAYARAQSIWSQTANARWMAYVASRRARSALMQADDVRQAVQLHAVSLAESRRTGRLYNEAIALGFAAPATLALGDIEQARCMAADGLLLAQQCDNPSAIGLSLSALGNVMIAMQRYDDAVGFADQLGALTGLAGGSRAAGLVRASAHWWAGDWVAVASILQHTAERNIRAQYPFHAVLVGGQVVCAAEHVGAQSLAAGMWTRVVDLVQRRATAPAVALLDRMQSLRAALRGEDRPVQQHTTAHPHLITRLDRCIGQALAGQWPRGVR